MGRLYQTPAHLYTYNHSGRPCMIIRSVFRILGLSILCLLLSILTNGIDTHKNDQDYRCSHVPPAPDQVAHIWLNDANYKTDSSETEPGVSQESQEEPNSIRAQSKRDIKELATGKKSNRNTTRIHFGRRGGRVLSQDAELLPITIQVYYDDSVQSLEPEKRTLITQTVIPTVVKFFESVLSIRRDFTIDKFRISRRCPNNTFYYVRDSSIVSLSRPYCMDKCEDYAICGEMVVPQSHLAACSYCNFTSKRCLTNHSSEGEGVPNTQLLIYVSAKQTPRCRKDQTIAYAAHCAQDSKTDRPVAGHANLCPLSISTDPKDLKALIATVKHELTHVLGFSVSLFAYYRDEYGLPYTQRDSTPGQLPVDKNTGYARWSDRIIKKLVRKDWVTGGGKGEKEVYLIVTPTVKREVRDHFNCSTLEGAELEDQGSDGTSMTHWEKRLFENEAMTGTHTQNSVFSRITLAVLQDSGWYVANFSRAEKLDWGRNLGCDFVKKSCKSWINERRAANMSIRPFCDRVKGDLLQISCTEDRSSKAICNMKQYNDPLPPMYQNFDHLVGVTRGNVTHFGGSVDLADYCPFIQEFTWQSQNVTVRGSRCDIGDGIGLDLERNAALELYGPQTICFEHGRRWEQRSCVYKRHWLHYGSGCYKYSCLDGRYSISVGNIEYNCYYQGQVIYIEQTVDNWLYNGTIICPACEEICPSNSCQFFDKQIVDMISNYTRGFATILDDADLYEVVRKFLDESQNLIEAEIDQNITKFPERVKSKQNSSTHREIRVEDVIRYKEHLMQVYLKRPPRRKPFVCSSAGSLRLGSIRYAIYAIVIISSLIASQRFDAI